MNSLDYKPDGFHTGIGWTTSIPAGQNSVPFVFPKDYDFGQKQGTALIRFVIQGPRPAWFVSSPIIGWLL